MNVSDISTNNKSYFSSFLKTFQYQRILTTRGKAGFSFAELQILSACHYAKYPPSNNYLIKITGLAKSTVIRNRKSLIARDLITSKNEVTDKFKSLSCLVKGGSGKFRNWKYFESEELSRLENRIFSFLVSLESRRANRKIEISVNSICRLCLVDRNNRHKTRLALKRLRDLDLIKIGGGAYKGTFKLSPPPKPFWAEAKAIEAPKPPKIAPNARQEQKAPEIAPAQLEARKWLYDPKTKFWSGFTREIFDFYRSRNLEINDAANAAFKITDFFADYFYKNNALEHSLYYEMDKGQEWAKKVIKKFDPKRCSDIESYFKACIQNIQLR